MNTILILIIAALVVFIGVDHDPKNPKNKKGDNDNGRTEEAI